MNRGRTRPDAPCPIRPGEPCTLCELGTTTATSHPAAQ
ncbi:DUF6767 domain-containing protein [Actinoplanes sp. CA-051413]